MRVWECCVIAFHQHWWFKQGSIRAYPCPLVTDAMNTSTSPALVYFELLADRAKTPSALLLNLLGDRVEVLRTFVGNDDFKILSARFPCLLMDVGTMSGEMVEVATEVGCRPIPQAAVYYASSLAMELPASAKWIAGDWYLAPPAKPTSAQAASRALALQLVQLVAADADTHEIEAVLRRDPTLSYHLLRVVNSLGMGMSRQITSFSQAILILGRTQLRRWLNLMLFSSRQGDERSAMLLGHVAVRARIMELLAKCSGMDRAGQDSAFMAGMFSLLGVLFGMPLDEVLRPLKISDALSAAVLEHQGDLGHLLKTVECVECRDTPQLAAHLDALQVPYAEFSTLSVQAYAWMLDVIRDRGGMNV